MNNHSFTRASLTGVIFLASLACIPGAMAADIRKCIGANGHVTLTDEGCPVGTRSDKILVGQAEPASQPDPAAVPAASGAERANVSRVNFSHLAPRYVNLPRSSASARPLSLDTETLRTARARMQLADALRGQRMASLQ